MTSEEQKHIEMLNYTTAYQPLTVIFSISNI